VEEDDVLVPMAKVEVIGHRPRLDDVLAVLYGLRAVQVLDVRSAPELRSATPAGGTDDVGAELASLATRVESLLALDPFASPSEPPECAAFDASAIPALRSQLDDLAPCVRAAVARLDDLRAEREVLPRHLASFRRLRLLVPDLVELRTYTTAVLMLERQHAHLVDLLHDELAASVGNRFEVYAGPVDPETVGAVLIFPRGESARIDAWLGREHVSQLRMPTRFAGLPVREAIAAMEARIAELDAEIEEAERSLHALLEPHLATWEGARRFVHEVAVRAEAARSAGLVGNAFVVLGWTPEREVPRLRVELERAIGSDVIVVEVPLTEAERHAPPLLLANRRVARPFEFLVRMFGLPRYGTLDPTPLMAVFLPLFFGMMVGDVVYGVIIAAIALLVRRRYAGRSAFVRDMTHILLLGAAWAIVWGVVFGEGLGNLGAKLGMHPLWVNREEAITALILFAVAVGAAHVVLGLVLGVWNSWRSRDRARLGEKAGLLACLCALFALIGVVAERLPHAMLTPSIVVLAIGLVVLVVLGGRTGAVTAPLELLGAVGNVLSYIRIAAIGLASVFLARVANELGGIGGPVWMGVLIAALFHTLNVALGTFSPTIQALRLHYVEFFDKFYEPGGRAFEPFGPPEGSLSNQAATT
jgi:V/A-type H+-transporting ATPase subunit I